MPASSLAVALGGALGSLGRYWIAELFVALGVLARPRMGLRWYWCCAT